MTGLSFRGYKERDALFPEKEQTTFYDPNKEYIMKSLNPGHLPWNRMTNRPVVDSVQNETPEESYDHMKAVAVKTGTLKPRSVALSNFSKVKGRDDKLWR